MAQRTRRLITNINQENDGHAAQAVKLPGKAALATERLVPLSRRPALRDVGNKAVAAKEAAAGKPAAVLKKNVTIDKSHLATKTVNTTTTSSIVVKEEAKATKIDTTLKRQESILTRKSSNNTVQVVPVEDAYSSKRFANDPDANDGGNLLLVSEYVKEIHEYLRELEDEYPIRKDFLSAHKSTSRMRSVLVNWLVEVH